MPDSTDTHIGEQLKTARKLSGFSQRELASVSGVSLSTIRKLEQGERRDTRLETARKLAAALRVPTSTLMPAEADTPSDTAGTDRWAAVRTALTDPEPDDIEEPPTVTGVREALDRAVTRYAGGHLTGIGQMLPSLIRDVEVLAELDPRGVGLRTQVMQITGRLMTQTRQYDAAQIALTRAGQHIPDQLHGAAWANTCCWLLLRSGRLREARELAIRWADEVEPRITRASAGELAAWGWLLLRVAATSARDNRSGAADQALFYAQAAAVAMGRRRVKPSVISLRSYTPATVVLQRAERAMVEDRPDDVLRMTSRAGWRRLPRTSGNRNRHRLDVAEAQVRTRRHGDAMETLMEVWRDAPQWMPHQRYAQEILGRVISKRRTLTPQMRELARAIGVL